MHVTEILTYKPKDTFLHRLDARLKVLTLFGGSVGIFFLGIIEVAISVVILIAILAASGERVLKVLKSLRGIIVFLAIGGVGNAFLYPGEIVYRIGSASVTKEGLIVGSLIVSRLVFLFLASATVSLTTSPLKLAKALEWYIAPLKYIKVNTAEIAFVISLTLRAIPMLAKEAAELRKSQEAKGIRLKGSARERLHAIYIMLVPLVFLAIKRSEEMAIAMEARAYPPEE